MRALFGVIAAASLASCGGGATNQSANAVAGANAQSPDITPPGNAALSNDTAAAPGNTVQDNAMAPAGADSWAGDYGGDLDVEIRDGRRPGSYRVEISTTSGGGGGCMGVVTGTATASGDRLAFVATDEDAGPGAQCRIAINRRGGDLVIEEGEGCSAFRGVSCAFEGTVSRQSR